jgi:5'-nucleotidase
MRFLIVNDDGINAEGIKLLAKWAMQYGEVTVVAPKHEQSGKSHAIDFINPIEIKRVDFLEGVEAWSMESTPADCVRFGIFGLHRQYDLVLSGINYGVNVGQDIVYSGTVAAVFEAARMGIKGIAFSTFPHSQKEAAQYFDMAYDYIVSNNLFDDTLIYNVNIPERVCGIRITYQGSPYFDAGFDPLGDDMYMQTGDMLPDEFPTDLDRDTVAVKNGFISVTPLTLSRLNSEAYKSLKNSGL